MSTKRSSILFYFDSFHRVADLPDEQLGVLFRALMECGEAEANGKDGITGFVERYPNMGDKAQMAFSFMADTIRRDAAAYAEKCAGQRASFQRGREPRKVENGWESRKEENNRELAGYVRQLAQRKP